MPYNGSPISGEAVLEGFAEGTRIGAGRHEPPTPWRPQGRTHPWAAEAEGPPPRLRPTAAAGCTARTCTATPIGRSEAIELADPLGESNLKAAKPAAALCESALKWREKEDAYSTGGPLQARLGLL